MILLNFAHPLTPPQLAAIEANAGTAVTRLVERMPQLDHGAGFTDEVRHLVAEVGLSGGEWQTEPIVVNLPGYAAAAAILVAELHGRMGHFPTIVRLRPVEGSVPTRYEVAELVNLEQVRDEARKRR